MLLTAPTPHRLAATLTPAQEIVIVELRKSLFLALDNLLVVTREFLNPAVSRSGLDRCLRRHGASNLKATPREEGAKEALKPFNAYAPGFLHVDIKYLPQMPDEAHRRFLFVAIDRATRWVYVESCACANRHALPRLSSRPCTPRRLSRSRR
jgi:hypothetical protein